MKKIYLSIPYSWNPDVSYKVANEISAKLMQEGNIVFSPISHSHPIAEYLPKELQTDSDWWMTQDLYWIEHCDEIVIVDLFEYDGTRLIQESRGVQMEYKRAGELGKDINYYIYYGV
jgi:nucleoside 2-deoxyribosyltransferase